MIDKKMFKKNIRYYWKLKLILKLKKKFIEKTFT